MPEQYEDFAHVTGRVGRDAEVRDVKDSQVAVFSVAKRLGFGEGQTQWYDVEVWATRRNGEHEPLFDRVKGIRKGQLVGIESYAPKSRDHNDKTYYTLRAINVWRLADLEEQGDDW